MASQDIWVYGDTRGERFFGYSKKVLAKARLMAEETGQKACLVLPGFSGPAENGSPGVCFPQDQAAEEALEAGAHVVYLLDDPGLSQPLAHAYSRVLSAFARDRSPALFLFPLTEFNRDVAARSAMLCQAGLIADCADIGLEDGQVVASCPSWGGRILAKIVFTDPTATGFATVQAQALPRPGDIEKTGGEIIRVQTTRLDPDSGPRLMSRVPEEPDPAGLDQARVVVAGGAGLGNAEGFARLRGLAASLGGQVGATRPPVMNHWVEEDRLIGQTGKTVRPGLMLSIGASGAVQYTAGILESGFIVAVNRDKKAPIFEEADLGIVGDAAELVPLITAEAGKALMRRLADGACEARDLGEDTDLGPTVVRLRENQNWTREDLAHATDQTPDFIEQVESGEVTPSVSFLLRLARALGVDPGTFLGEDEKTALKDQREKDFVKRTKNYCYECLTPGAESEHLRAFMITIESHHAHKPVAYKHEGEEFVYVLEGDLELTLGGKPLVLKPGESKRFNSEIPHKLKSLSDEMTRCLVILYTP